MSIVEQAAKRLEELRRAGVSVPWVPPDFPTALGPIRRAAPEIAPSVAAVVSPSADLAPMLRKIGSQFAASGVAGTVGHVPIQRRPLGASTHVAIDFEHLRASGFLIPGEARSDLAEEFRTIKRPLLRNARDKLTVGDGRGSLIMVTSALPGEGKTFCSINLAMSMAMEVDTAVLLVDADVQRPAVLSRLGIRAEMGLLDLLMRPELGLSDVVLETNVPKLSILPTGTLNSRSNELLASDAMEALLSELASKHSDLVIVFDAPPLLLTTEGQVLASRMGQILLVVEASQTTSKTVALAFAAVEQCPLVHSLLNKCTKVTNGRGYERYYG